MQAKVAPDEKAARRFQSAMRDVMRISGKDFETVIKHELGAALTSAVKMTKKATVKTIQNNHEKRPGARYSLDYSGPESRTGKQYTPEEVARLRQRAAERRSAGKGGKLVYYFSRSTQPKASPAWLWRFSWRPQFSSRQWFFYRRPARHPPHKSLRVAHVCG